MKIGEESKHQLIEGFGCAFCGGHRIVYLMTGIEKVVKRPLQ